MLSMPTPDGMVASVGLTEARRCVIIEPWNESLLIRTRFDENLKHLGSVERRIVHPAAVGFASSPKNRNGE